MTRSVKPSRDKGNLKNLVKRTKIMNRTIVIPDSPKLPSKKFNMTELLRELKKKCGFIIIFSDFSIEDSRLSNFFYRKVMLVDYSCMFFAMLGLML